MPGFLHHINRIAEALSFLLLTVPILTIMLPTLLAVITISFHVSCFFAGFDIVRRARTEGHNAFTAEYPVFREENRQTDPHNASTRLYTAYTLEQTNGGETGECVPTAPIPNKRATRPRLQRGTILKHHPQPPSHSAIRGNQRGVDILSPLTERHDPYKDMAGVPDSGREMGATSGENARLGGYGYTGGESRSGNDIGQPGSLIIRRESTVVFTPRMASETNSMSEKVWLIQLALATTLTGLITTELRVSMGMPWTGPGCVRSPVHNPSVVLHGWVAEFSSGFMI